MIGCGNMAASHMHAYRRLASRGVNWFEIVAVCDPEISNATEFSKRLGEFFDAPKIYAQPQEMLASESLDCVDTSTPHFLHHTIALQAMDAGLDVMVEKPLGVTMKAARLMCDGAERTQRILATAEQVRRWTGPRAVKWAIDEGLIGRPQAFFIHASGGTVDHSPDSAEPQGQHTWRNDKLTGGGGPIFDGGVHTADLLIHLFGDLEKVYASVDRLRSAPSRGANGDAIMPTVEDTSIAQMTFANGVIGTWTLASCVGERVVHTIYYGSDGSISAADGGGFPLTPRLQRWNGDVSESQELIQMFVESLDAEEKERLFPQAVMDDPITAKRQGGYHNEEGDYGVALECYDFLCAVRDRRPPEIDGWAGRAAQAVPEAFFESSHLGEAVRIADVVSGEVDGYQAEINERWGL